MAFTYNLIIDNGLSSYLQAVKDIEHAEAVDDTTVRFTMSAPKSDMLYVIVYIIPEHLWADVPVKTLERSYKNPMPMVGSGPFQVVEFEKGSFTRLVRNPDYWGNDVPGWGTPGVDQLIFQAYQNPDTMTQDLRTGTLDAAQGVPAAQFAALKGDAGLKTIAYNFINWDYIDFNCYDSPESGGNPVLRDPAFRVALDYAVDRERVVQVVYNGRAAPGYTMLTTDTWRDPDFHWEPPAGVKRPYDPAKAAQLLDDAGYRDADGDGVREDEQGKPISLRLWALAESPSTQAEGKLITGWFEQLGLDIRFEVVDNGVASDAMYAWKGDSPAPDYDMILWFWDGYWDPGSTLQCFTTSQIGWWNEIYWSNAEYDRLCDEQGHELDLQRRADLIHQMQEVMYEENPQEVLTYFDYLQAVNVEKWTGWSPYYDDDGPVIYNFIQQSYINIRPKAVAGRRSLERRRRSVPSPASPSRRWSWPACSPGGCCGGAPAAAPKKKAEGPARPLVPRRAGPQTGAGSVKKNVAPLPAPASAQHAAAVAAHEALHRGQADAVALELPRRVHALEDAEEVLGVGHVEADAVVAHEEGVLAAVVHARRPRRARVSRGAVNFQALPRSSWRMRRTSTRVGLGGRGRARRPRRPCREGLLGGDLLADLLREGAQVDACAAPARDATRGEPDEFVHEAGQRLRGGAHPPQIVRALRRQPLALVFDDHGAEAVDRAQRSAHVVGHGVGQRLQLTGGGLELLRCGSPRAPRSSVLEPRAGPPPRSCATARGRCRRRGLRRRRPTPA